MTAALQTLEVYSMYPQTSTRIARVREFLAEPLEYTPPSDDPDLLVEGQVLPENIRKNKYFLTFHADKESSTKGQPRPFIFLYLRYSRRPSGAIPRFLTTRRERGFTSEWVEKTITKIGNPVMLVDATLIRPSEERKTSPVPPLLLGDTVLKHCGQEYRSESMGIGNMSRYRWLEERGKVRVWLEYSYVAARLPTEGLWIGEEKRCRKYLRQLR